MSIASAASARLPKPWRMMKSAPPFIGVGIAVVAAIAAAGIAGDGLEEAFGTPEKSGDTESLRKAS